MLLVGDNDATKILKELLTLLFAPVIIALVDGNSILSTISTQDAFNVFFLYFHDEKCLQMDEPMEC